jgi:multidrug transporter EmrE-like cation transporter
MTLSSIWMLLAASLAAACGQLLLKVGAQHRTHVVDFLNTPVAIGLLLYLCGTIVWIYVLSKEKLVVVYAFTALTFVLVYLGAVLTLGESLTLKASGGVALVLAGLYLLAT